MKKIANHVTNYVKDLSAVMLFGGVLLLIYLGTKLGLIPDMNEQ